MKIQKNVKLATKTTLHIGGYTKTLYLPENEEELIHTAAELYEKEGKVYLLSGGSNLLINDQREFESVISMKEACTELTDLGNGRFYIGASNRIQKVISFVNERGYGGFEELIGLPAMFGGIVCMNAGIGGESAPLFTIAEFVKNVKVFNLEKDGYRVNAPAMKFCTDNAAMVASCAYFNTNTFDDIDVEVFSRVK